MVSDPVLNVVVQREGIVDFQIAVVELFEIVVEGPVRRARTYVPAACGTFVTVVIEGAGRHFACLNTQEVGEQSKSPEGHSHDQSGQHDGAMARHATG